MEKVDKDVAAMLRSLKKYDQLVESVAPVLGMKTLSSKIINEDDTIPESRLYHTLVKFLKAAQQGEGRLAKPGNWTPEAEVEVKKVIQLLHHGDIETAVRRLENWSSSFGDSFDLDEIVDNWMRGHNIETNYVDLVNAMCDAHGLKWSWSPEDDEAVKEDGMEENVFRNPNLPADKQLPDPPKEIDMDIDEGDMEEGNEFSGELAKAKSQHQDKFTVGGETYPVKEQADPEVLAWMNRFAKLGNMKGYGR